MANYSLCSHDECEKRNMCKRYTIRESINPVYPRFYNICHSNNGYKYIIEMEVKEELVVKEEDT